MDFANRERDREIFDRASIDYSGGQVNPFVDEKAYLRLSLFFESLSDTKRIYLNLLGMGFDNRRIGEILGRQTHTVKTMFYGIYIRLADEVGEFKIRTGDGVNPRNILCKYYTIWMERQVSRNKELDRTAIRLLKRQVSGKTLEVVPEVSPSDVEVSRQVGKTTVGGLPGVER